MIEESQEAIELEAILDEVEQNKNET